MTSPSTNPKIEEVAGPGTGHGDFMIGGTVWPGLSKLIEECGEVLQVGGKLMGSSGSTAHWSGDLRQMLVEELGDLTAAITFFAATNKLDLDAIGARSEEKILRFMGWHRDTLLARSDNALAKGEEA